MDTENRKHLLGISELTRTDIESVLESAKRHLDNNRKRHMNPIFQGHTLINAFFEPSTRTMTAFELAAKRLGMEVCNFTTGNSSMRKGESVHDTIMTLAAMNADVITVRHSENRTPHGLIHDVPCSIINGGDGNNEHPTQALGDALAIMQEKGSLDGLLIAICGDAKHSRVARSNILLFNRMGAHVRVVAPEQFQISDTDDNLNYETATTMEQGLQDADIVMMLRMQTERIQDADLTLDDYYRHSRLDSDTLEYAKPDALVMHPGPIHRDGEIASEIADGGSSLILKQVEAGVAARMAVIESLLE